MLSLFVVTAPGLETCTQQELAGLGINAQKPQAPSAAGELLEESGGVEFEASQRDLYQANLHLRTASRILARLGDFFSTTFSELRKKAAHLAWEQFLQPGTPVALRVTCHRSKLYHSDAVAERVAASIADRLGQTVKLTKFDEDAALLPQLVVVRLVNDHCTISIDTSGERLHRRGYRLETAKAPLRETLAAGLLMLSGWDGVACLVDPFCGSGTIPIEAALRSQRIPAGINRRFAFMDWPNFDASMWKSLLVEAETCEQPCGSPILASDRDAGAIRIAQANAERAGVAGSIQFSCRAFSAVEPPVGVGWLVTNPPYGVRISAGHDLRNLYAQWGNVLRKLFYGWNFGFLCSGEYLAGHTRLQFEQRLPLLNGGRNVQFFTGRVG